MDLVEGKDLGRVLRHRPLKDEDLWTCEHEERGGDLWRVFDDFDGSFCRGSFLQFLLFLALFDLEYSTWLKFLKGERVHEGRG